MLEVASMIRQSLCALAVLFAAGTGLPVVGMGNVKAECYLAGESVAEPNPDDPDLGDWRYTVTMEWDTGTQHAVSHLDLLLALEACPDVCEAFPFAVLDTVGSGPGIDQNEESCTVYYQAEFNCIGDPSIGIEDPLIKFEPISGGYCEPDVYGTVTFRFYTDWSPTPVSQPNDLLVLKAAQGICRGELSGSLPECMGSQTSTHSATWGQVKSCYLR
jgi:hypothetical protein